MAFADWFNKQSLDTQVSAAVVYGQLQKLISLRQSSSLQGITAAKQTAINVLVPQLSALRIGIYDRGNGKRVKNYLHEKLNYYICNSMTGYNFWQSIYYNLIRYNNAYALKKGLGDKVTSLKPLPSRLMIVMCDENSNSYNYAGKSYTEDEIFHIRLNTDNGLLGKAYEDEVYSFELAGACERMAYDFFQNGGNVKRIWKMGAGLSPEQLKDLQAVLDAAIKGQLRQQLDVILPTGLEYENIQGDLEKSQMIETRKYQSKEILALYGIDLEKLNLEQIYNVAIVPILENVEQAITMQLLTPQEQAKYKISYVVAGRFRGDTKAQYEIISKALSVLSITECREWIGYSNAGPEYDAIINPHTSSAKVNEQRQGEQLGTNE